MEIELLNEIVDKLNELDLSLNEIEKDIKTTSNIKPIISIKGFCDTTGLVE